MVGTPLNTDFRDRPICVVASKGDSKFTVAAMVVCAGVGHWADLGWVFTVICGLVAAFHVTALSAGRPCLRLTREGLEIIATHTHQSKFIRWDQVERFAVAVAPFHAVGIVYAEPPLLPSAARSSTGADELLPGALSLGPAELADLLNGWRIAFASPHCRHCGYDLRATPEKCPECGAASVRG